MWTTESDFDRSDETENTIYSTTNSKTTTSVITKVNAYKTGKHDTTVISIERSKPTRTTAPVPTVTIDSDVPRPDNGANNNTILVVIGGVIGLFLGILVLQMCVKLMMSRKKKKKRESLRRASRKVEEEEETYQEINEAMMETSRKDDVVNHPRLEKYYELKFLNPDSEGMSYRKLGTGIKRQDIGLSSSSTRSDSTKSSDSYVKPATNGIEGQDYLDVVHPAKEQDKFIDDSQKDGTEEGCFGELHPSSLSNRKLGTEIKRQDIGLSTSSTRSDSIKSSDSYIKPATNRFEGQDYLDVVHTAKEQDKFIVDSQKDGTEEGCLGELHPSSLYLEPVCVTDQPQVGSIASSCSPCGDRKTYLDVIQ